MRAEDDGQPYGGGNVTRLNLLGAWFGRNWLARENAVKRMSLGLWARQAVKRGERLGLCRNKTTKMNGKGKAVPFL